jgi:hypothetical protein
MNKFYARLFHEEPEDMPEWRRAYAYLPTKVSRKRYVWLEFYETRKYWTDGNGHHSSRWVPFTRELQVTERREIGSSEVFTKNWNAALSDFCN